MRRSIWILTAILLAVCLLGQVSPEATLAANPNVGYVDFSFGSAPGADPTADKPQSKLWWNDGIWWAVMFNESAGEWHIYQLSWPSQWIDTGTLVDTRPTSRADALWDGTKLYIASLVRLDASNVAQLLRYSYSPSSRTYTPDNGFPTTIMTGRTETLAFDKDSTGRLWTAYTQGSKVYVNHTDPGDATWGTRRILDDDVGSDDIASLVAFQGKIGVLWSDQGADTMYFSSHVDGTADTSWSPAQAIYTGSNAADDHINLKSFQADSTGRLFAAVKTSTTGSNATLIHLLSRSPNGTWQSAVFGRGSDNHTRPLVLLDSTNRMVYMFATSPTSCGIIYMKSTSMDNLSFVAGKGEPFVSSSTYTCLNNVTSTKQTLSSATGLVVLASDESKEFYLHNVLELGSPPPDTAPPLVTDKTPAAGAANIAVAANVSATFSEAVSGVSASSFTLTPAGGSAVAAAVTYDPTSRTATLNPSVDLSYNTTYTAQLAGSIVDGAGNPLAPISWSFTTAGPPPDTTPPTVIARSPLNGATGVSLAANVTVAFSEDMAPTSITAASVTLTGATNVAASVSYNAANRTLTLNPIADLAPSSNYTVQLSSTITDLFGNSLAPVGWSFSTAAQAPDTIAPTVISISPTEAASGVSTTTAVSATFSEPIDSATLTGLTFTLTSANGAVAATVVYQSATRTATLQPHAPLPAGMTYSVRIAGVRDLAGNELADAATWSFSTATTLQQKLLVPVLMR
ncbi:MAG TPA: Ig-like domain-containing protein [Roseiflexaceae bacterium]|nr:Ig-like domain-containing protein [Roseiflexaceae bacterium]